MSEPLFITLSLTALCSLIEYDRTRKTTWLITSSIFAGLTAFTRYAGLALIGAIGLYLWLLDNPWKVGTSAWLKSRGRDLAIFLPISIAPIVGYFLYNLSRIGRVVGHQAFSWSLLKDTPWQSLWLNVLNWLIPKQVVGGRLTFFLAAFLFPTLVLILLLIISDRGFFNKGFDDLRRRHTWLVMVIYIVIYLLLLVFARGVLQGRDAFYERFLYPIQIVALILGFSAIGYMFRESNRIVKFAPSVGTLGIFLLLGVRAIYTIQFLNREGLRYASQRWHISETIAYLSHRPDTSVMSTGAPGIYFWTGRRPVDIADSQAEVRQFLCETEGFLVIIDALPLELYGASPDVTEGLIIEQDFSEGTIYRIDP